MMLSRFFLLFLFNRFIFLLLFPLQPIPKLIASSSLRWVVHIVTEKPLCMIKEKYIVMYILAATN